MDKIKAIKQGDTFTFMAGDNKYKAILCTSVGEKSPIVYTFAALNYSHKNKPLADDLINSEFFGIANYKDGSCKYLEKDLENMWTYYPEMKPYFLGCYGFLIWRKDFFLFRDNFSFVSNLKIVNNLNINGNGSVNASSWSFLKGFFNENIETKLKDRGQKQFRVKAIVCS